MAEAHILVWRDERGLVAGYYVECDVVIGFECVAVVVVWGPSRV